MPAQQFGANLTSGGGAQLTINSGGTLNVDSANQGESLNVNGSPLVNNGTIIGTTNVNYGATASGSGTFGPINVTAGTLAVYGGTMRSSGVVLNNATIEGSGMLMAAGTIATTVTVTPAAGLTLTLANSLSGPGQLIENGQGTLLLTGSNSYGGGTTIASGTLQVGNGGSGASLGGGPVADNGALVFNHADNVAFSPAVSGNGSLTQTGSGVLTLLASNTYSGPTTINQGMLEVNGSLLSPMTVNSGGTLSGTGYLGSVTIAPNGQLAPGNALGAMNLSGSLNLESGAVMDYDLDTPSTSSEILMPSGELILSGQQFSDFNFMPTANFIPGIYPLIEAGSVSGSLGSSSTGTIDGYPATLLVQGNDLVLVVPEPSAVALFAAAALGLAGYGLRRRLARRTPKRSTIDPDAPAILPFRSRSSANVARRAA